MLARLPKRSFQMAFLACAMAFALASILPAQAGGVTERLQIAWDEVMKTSDPKAIEALAAMPRDEVIPFLNQLIFVYGSDTPERKAAIETLVKIPDYADYYAEKTARAAKADRMGDDVSFMILAEVKTPEAIRVIAEYAFDLTPPSAKSDVRGSSNIVRAVSTLRQMNLPGAPARPEKDGYIEVMDVITWQRWLIEQGHVPPEYKKRVGVPRWLAVRQKSLGVKVDIPDRLILD